MAELAARYASWEDQHLVIDTAGVSSRRSLIRSRLGLRSRRQHDDHERSGSRPARAGR